MSRLQSRVGGTQRGAAVGSASPRTTPPGSARRYAHVAAVVDTGPTVLGMQTVTVGQVARRRREVFGRVTAASLQAWLEEDASHASSSPSPSPSPAGGGGATGPHVVTVAAGATATRPPRRLLLDVRPADAFAASHITGSVSYPIVQLHQDRLPRALAEARTGNWREDVTLVVIDEAPTSPGGDEAATTLAQQGYASVLLLDGGASVSLLAY